MILDKNTDKNFKAMLGKTGDATFQVPIIDSSSRHLVALTDGEHEIHDGRAFTAFFAITTAGTNGHRSGIYIKTPATPDIHMLFSGSSSTAANITISEAPTIAANTGTAAGVIFNRKRESANTSSVFDNATTPAENKFTTINESQFAGDGTWNTGTILRQQPLSIGVGPRPAGGDSRDQAEYVLKPNTKYVLLITNTAASANDHLVQLDWYEHISLEP
ncbi:hypothetical protein LCGC14_1611070 [marine sediment metagenome]|uniref:Uncharacterized protein n=1 Tax=marine sediment metagenome TaxID=412755 RepID=A0A0F9KP02_9ZZZZ